jgi:hypothetical protein
MKTRSVAMAVIFLGLSVGGGAAARADLIPVETGDHIKLYDADGRYSNGGPFWVDNLRDNGKRDTQREFQTFCLERDETLSFDTDYRVELSKTAWMGGVNTDAGDPLDVKTAYLYSNFFYHTDLAKTWSTQNLQEVIWYLEDEFANENHNLSGGAKALLAMVKNLNFTADEEQSLFNVRVMNLYDAAGNHHQSLLTVVPEPATVVLWGICGACGLIMVRRRKRVA